MYNNKKKKNLNEKDDEIYTHFTATLLNLGI